MENQEKAYLTTLKAELEAVNAELQAEITKQERRPNRESERRTRKILSGLAKRLYRPYKEASLADLASGTTEAE